jgi:hypothetical protein
VNRAGEQHYWATKGFLLLAIVAAAGLIASIAVHVLSWLQIEPPGGKSVVVLHLGFLLIWFPLVLYANRTMPKAGQGNLDHLLAELPPWVRVAIGCLFAYALINFVYFLFLTRQYPKHGVPFFVELHGFSGHWMLFYGMATAGFIALARLETQ